MFFSNKTSARQDIEPQAKRLERKTRGLGKNLEKSASLRKNRPMKDCDFCIPINIWVIFPSRAWTLNQLISNEEAPKGSRYAKADFSGFD
ncbi:MAG: hypothetical protein KME30_14110 [Iphinoe sp. HA4291-MV1]|jgi:hypothetical protein|nr:hypothetical protein [Iphinoe sp. HA4291-MV1]